MENLSSHQQILDKVEEIVHLIQESEKYKNYLYLEKKMKEHPKVSLLIETIKAKQKQLVQKEYQGLDMIEEEKELQLLQDELEAIPLYMDFLHVQEELNSLFGWVKQSVEDLFQF